jgi:Protein of unknown function DUF114.
LKLLEQKDINNIDDKTLILADVSKKAIGQLEHFVYDLLKIATEKKRQETFLSFWQLEHGLTITLLLLRRLAVWG